MANKDFNNGLIIGLALKGLPYGLHADYKPNISNSNTFSIVIDFKIPIENLPENYNQRGLWFYSQQEVLDELKHLELTPTNWERINDSTIEFSFEDFKDLIPPMVILATNYDGIDYGSINMPYFKVEYMPYGVPTRLKVKDILPEMGLNNISMGSISDSMNTIVLTPILIESSDNISGMDLNNISMGTVIDSVIEVVLEEV